MSLICEIGENKIHFYSSSNQTSILNVFGIRKESVESFTTAINDWMKETLTVPPKDFKWESELEELSILIKNINKSNEIEITYHYSGTGMKVRKLFSTLCVK